MRTRATVEIILFDDREARCDNTVITVAYYGLFNDVRCHKSNITSGEVFNGFDPVQTVETPRTGGGGEGASSDQC